MNGLGDLSPASSRRVIRLVELLQHELGHRVIGLIGVAESGTLCVIPQPGYEVEVMTLLGAVNWGVAVRLAEEHAP